MSLRRRRRLMALLVAAFFVGALPAGAVWGLTSSRSWKPVVLATIAGFVIARGILFLAGRAPPPSLDGWRSIEPGAWPRSGFVGDFAYWAFQISLWFASFGLGASLAAWSKTGRIQRAAALILAIVFVPIIFIAWIWGVIAINCSYSFNQIGHACY